MNLQQLATSALYIFVIKILLRTIEKEDKKIALKLTTLHGMSQTSKVQRNYSKFNENSSIIAEFAYNIMSFIAMSTKQFVESIIALSHKSRSFTMCCHFILKKSSLISCKWKCSIKWNQTNKHIILWRAYSWNSNLKEIPIQTEIIHIIVCELKWSSFPLKHVIFEVSFYSSQNHQPTEAITTSVALLFIRPMVIVVDS